uniref:Uncharacterized protein n=1 Tax=Molossus molossus TaxID=27622 RepID=A0A7J8JVX3_MOLMO|nr:hypothetical protein HJG59_008012 [Molossus molossus]
MLTQFFFSLFLLLTLLQMSPLPPISPTSLQPIAPLYSGHHHTLSVAMCPAYMFFGQSCHLLTDPVILCNTFSLALVIFLALNKFLLYEELPLTFFLWVNWQQNLFNNFVKVIFFNFKRYFWGGIVCSVDSFSLSCSILNKSLQYPRAV